MSDRYTHLGSLRLQPKSLDANALLVDDTSGSAMLTVSTAGAVTLGSTLAVTGTSTFTGASTFTGDVTVTGTVLGDLKVYNLTNTDDVRTVTAAESGGIFILDTSGGKVDITLPAVAAGLHYTFIIKNATTESDITATAAILKGGIFQQADTNEDNYISLAGTTITMAAAAGVGDWVELIGGATNFYVKGQSSVQSKWSVA